MAVGILAVTHESTAETLLATARTVLGDTLPLATQAFAVPLNCDPDAVAETLRRHCQELDSGDGVLILTDLYGSTPCNVSTR